MIVPTRTPYLYDLSHLYPETDGLPMAEGTTQYRYIVTIKGGLDIQYRDDPNVFVAGDLFWYPVEGNNKIRVAPDVMVALGRPKGDRPSYLQWLEDNVPPQVVFEILSPGNRKQEMEDKFSFFERYGVQEYYLYDPEDRKLQGWQRVGAELVEIEAMDGWMSPLLGIRFELALTGLRVYGRDGRQFVDVPELDAQREEAEHQREEAERRVEQERVERQQAERRAEQERVERQQAERRAEQERVERQQAERRAEQERVERQQAERRAEQERVERQQAERRAEQERVERQQAERQAEQNQLEAEQARQKAERLAAQLRALGIEPEQ